MLGTYLLHSAAGAIVAALVVIALGADVVCAATAGFGAAMGAC